MAQINRRSDYINRILRENIAQPVKDAKYSSYLEKLQQLANDTDKAYKNSEPMTADQRSSYIKLYSEVYALGREYLSEGSVSRSRRSIINRLNQYIFRDLDSIRATSPEAPGKLRDAVSDGRRIRVDITGKKGSVLGNAQNARIALKTASGQKGFFTAKQTTSLTEEWLAVIETHGSLLSEENKKALRDFAHNYSKKLEVSKKLELTKWDDENERAKAFAEAIGLNTAGMKSKTLKRFADIIDNASKITKAQSFHEIFKLDEESRIDKKNIAMYEVAKFLGCENVIAKAVPMTIIQDGKETKGTFMENVTGEDLSSLRADSPLRKTTAEKLMTPAFRQQLNQIAILDYLCGNVDRHYKNMIYQVSDSGEITGIVGIDNDTSFPAADIRDVRKVMTEFASLENIGYIDQKTADMLMRMDKDMLKTIVRSCDIGDAQLDKAFDRLNDIKTAIEKNTITVVNDWSAPDIQHSKLEKDMCDNITKDIQTNMAKPKNVEFAEGAKLSDKDVTKYTVRSVANLADRMRDTDRFYIGSAEFKNMRNSMYSLEAKAKEIAQQLNSGEVAQDKLTEYKNALKDFIKSSDEYIDKKKLEPSTSHGVKRLNAAKDMQDKVWEIADALGVEIEKENKEKAELQADDMNISL